MNIGIDISQMVYEGTGVATYVRRMTEALIRSGTRHTFTLFGASFRRRQVFTDFVRSLGPMASRVRLVSVPIPPFFLDLLWNRWHIVPAEWFTGYVDVFWSSDWTQPPLVSAVGVTTIHDLSTVRYPAESHQGVDVDIRRGRIKADIVATHARRFRQVKKECDVVFCDSQATVADASDILHIPKQKLKVVYPGYP